MHYGIVHVSAHAWDPAEHPLRMSIRVILTSCHPEYPAIYTADNTVSDTLCVLLNLSLRVERFKITSNPWTSYDGFAASTHPFNHSGLACKVTANAGPELCETSVTQIIL